MNRSSYCLFYWGALEGRKCRAEVGRCVNEGRKHAADREHSLRPVITTTETTRICSQEQEHIHTAHVNIHVPSLAVKRST